MNIRLVARQLGLLTVVLSIMLLGIWIWSFALTLMGDDAEHQAHGPFLITALIGFSIGGILWFVLRGGHAPIGRRESLLLVGTSWLIGAALSALPFLLWAYFSGNAQQNHPFGNFINCYFEAMSGLTTTGSTVLSDIEALPRSILLWRSLIQWLGGLGIVVLFVAVLPTLGVGGKKLFRVEAPGPDPEGVRPQIRDTARVLWFIYLGLTAAEILCLKFIGGISWFDSICHTFTTLATGGFSTLNASIGEYNATVQWIITVFMIAAGINFALYFALLRRRIRPVFRDTEFRFYLFLITISAIVIITTLMASGAPIVLTSQTEGMYDTVPATLPNAIQYGLFTTVACQTTTGFCTADFNHWPFIAKVFLLTLMFVGGSAGSTTGGIKVARIWISIKVMISELERVFRPQVVRPLKVGHTVIDNDLKLATITYVFGIVLIFALGAVLIMVFEQWHNPAANIDFTTASTASIATLFNIGPGLEKVGAVCNFGWFSGYSKVLMCLLMAVGRLEVFAIIVLLSPRFWRGD